MPSIVLNILYQLFQQKQNLKASEISTLIMPILQMRELEHRKSQNNLPKCKQIKIFEGEKQQQQNSRA